MGEKMELDIDFRDAEAASRIQRLINLLERLYSIANDASKNVEKLGDSTTRTAKSEDQLASSTEKLTTAQREMGIQGAKVSAELDKHREKGIAAANAYLQMGEKGNRALSDTREKTDALSKITGGMSGQVTNWVGSYFGLNGVLKILTLMDDRMRSIAEIQSRLVGEKWTQDFAVKSIMDNLGLGGQSGQAMAVKLTNEMAQKTAMSFGQAANLIGAGAPFYPLVDRKTGQVDVKNRAALEQIGVFAARVGLEGKDELDGLFKLVKAAQAQGKTTQQALAVMDVVGMNTVASNQRTLMGSMVSAVLPAMSKGVSFDEAAAQYSVMASQARSPEAGADLTRMMFTAADANLPQVKKRVAAFAGAHGKLKGFSAATDVEFEAAVAAGTDDDAQAIRRMREDAARAPARARLEDEEFELSMKERSKSMSPERARHERDEYRLKVDERRQRNRKLQEELKQREGKFRGELDTDRQVAAFSKMSTTEKAEMAKGFFASVTSDEELAELMTMLGGRPEQAAALRMAASPTGRQLEQQVRQAMKAPTTVAAMEAKNRGYRETTPALNELAQNQRAAANAAAVMPGEETAQRWEDELKAEADRRIKSGEAGWISESGFNTWTDAGVVSDLMASNIYGQMQRFYSSLSPAEKASVQGQQIRELIAFAEKRLVNNVQFTSAGRQKNMARGTADLFFGLKSTIENRRAARTEALSPQTGSVPAAQPSAAPATQPSVEPPATQPHAPDPTAFGTFGAPIYNVSVGNLWTSPGGDLDLPGPFDR